MELHAREARAVLLRPLGQDGEPLEVDLGTLTLPAGLAEALHEWAEVAEAVELSEGAGEAVYQRGRHLAWRLAVALDTPVRYVDPVTGETEEIPPPPPVPVRPAEPVEPTPWATGLTVSVFVAAIVVVSIVALSQGLSQASPLLALGANVVIAGGLAPSVWLARRTPVWRWVSYGVVTGIGVAWLALLLSLLGP
ncbi:MULTISPECIES: DUF2537 domain-containing protein [unclassified Crossiella]|uniref:DUF2537 domain-containing protein n=1 Tax=unclassified Crossiella TaxID=2620835 RepID=UPI0020003D63|nr:MULTISPECIES: DUF2537 domain-containing protein [unclassified Crossiella]MCK2237991.1 DUF2537 domain-containing protein [Crossiella sp. S99.2]MCK2255274.1 DUF2537 domain-containing protein [Crossiella sp. S99.1]